MQVKKNFMQISKLKVHKKALHRKLMKEIIMVKFLI